MPATAECPPTGVDDSRPEHCHGTGFVANVALDVDVRDTGTDPGVTVDVFLLHQHVVENCKTGQWKETQIHVFLDKYAILRDSLQGFADNPVAAVFGGKRAAACA